MYMYILRGGRCARAQHISRVRSGTDMQVQFMSHDINFAFQCPNCHQELVKTGWSSKKDGMRRVQGLDGESYWLCCRYKHKGNKCGCPRDSGPGGHYSKISLKFPLSPLRSATMQKGGAGTPTQTPKRAGTLIHLGLAQ